MSLEVRRHRTGLGRTREAIGRGALTIGFVGGSITDPRPACNWPEPVVAWFVEKFPRVRIVVENAAIGATGSDLAVFRAERDLIARGCDLVFVEFAVNDSEQPTEKRMRTREGLIRKLLAGAGRDLVLTYTFRQSMYEPMMAGRAPASIAEFEQLAEHYGIGSVWMGLHALREVQQGRMRWEEWLPDGLHPGTRGSLSYAQSVTAFLERELIASPGAGELPAGGRRPEPLDPKNWEHTAAVPFDQVRTQGPWVIRRWANLEWIDQVLDTAAPGAKLAFAFQGRGLCVGFDFGKSSAAFRWRLDGGGWQTANRDRPDWCPEAGWYRLTVLADDLPAGPHECEIEVIHGDGPACTGTNFHLALLGVIQ